MPVVAVKTYQAETALEARKKAKRDFPDARIGAAIRMRRGVYNVHITPHEGMSDESYRQAYLRKD